MRHCTVIRSYNITEIFYSIQGEGLHTGVPMIFVRFSGCNQNCVWYDTDHRKAKPMSGEDIVSAIQDMLDVNFPNRTHTFRVPVCFTGGEPTLQLTASLVGYMHHLGFPLHLETNGTQIIPLPHLFETITISPKYCSALGVPLPCCSSIYVLKIVWEDKAMFETIDTWWRDFPFQYRYIQPLEDPRGETNVQEVVEYVKAHPRWRLGIQVHKVAGIQ